MQTITVSQLQEMSLNEFQRSCVLGDVSLHASVSAHELIAYMQRNELESAEVWVHTFSDDYTAICLKCSDDNFVEINQIPQQSRSFPENMPQPLVI